MAITKEVALEGECKVNERTAEEALYVFTT